MNWYLFVEVLTVSMIVTGLLAAIIVSIHVRRKK